MLKSLTDILEIDERDSDKRNKTRLRTIAI
jgi:hypothetical protein